jgi:xanthine dehydrogenase accessory factor
MHSQLLQMAADLARREEPFVLAVVVGRRPASSAQTGDMALVTNGGEFHGWLGGACTQPTVVREARRALADGQPRLISLSPEPLAAGDERRLEGMAWFPMTCHSGGSVEIYLDPIMPAPRIAVFGASPTARALARLGKSMGWSVLAAGPAADLSVFPEADQIIADLASPELAAAASRGPCFAVVATMGENDEESIRAALALRPAYLGVVASARRFAQIRQTLAEGGVPAAALDAIRSPAGLSIGAQAPEEIALSVLAEIVERRRAAPDAEQAAPARQARQAAEVTPAATAGEAAGTLAAAATAVDPICGMTVEVATARHTARHAGQTWYFCCGGCRERFLAAPARFAGQGAA